MVFCMLCGSHAPILVSTRTNDGLRLAFEQFGHRTRYSPHKLKVSLCMRLIHMFYPKELGTAEGQEDDTLSILTASSPRSRSASEVIFADFETLISLSERPPVGTTKPPVYPRPYDSQTPANQTRRLNRSRMRLVNRPLTNRSS